MKIGYARVSTKDQHLGLQLDALKKAGCEKIYQDIANGARSERPALNELMEKKVGLQSLHDPIDTTTAQGRLSFNLFASLAEFECDLIRERTHAGLSAARARGRNGGRPKDIPPKAEATACAAETLYKEGRLTVNEISEKLGIAKSTLYTYLRHRGVTLGSFKADAECA
jgi:DNA invertase Pin-like site-specific DNA recombinase